MSDINMQPCIVCGSYSRGLMGYDIHKVTCSNSNCVMHNLALPKDVWNSSFTESPLLKENSKLKAAKYELVSILQKLDNHYCDLINSGDAGNWNPNDEDVIKLTRKVINKHKDQSNG